MSPRLLFAVPLACLLLWAGFWKPPRDQPEYDSGRWIDSGLERERGGDVGGAERDLLRAARVDRLYLPAWTLAGFYFRQGEDEKFWMWARAALTVGQRDLGALFDLCWKKSDDPERIWARAMPDRKAAWDEYLYYLMTSNRWPAAAGVAGRIAAVADAHDQTILLNYCDLALAHEDRAGAAAVWRELSKRGVIPYSDGLLTNGKFDIPPAGHGFDWRVPPADGLTSIFRQGVAAFTLSGYEPESWVMMQQPLALDAEGTYRLRFEYKTDGLNSATGIRWEAGEAKGAVSAASEWRGGEFEFGGGAKSIALVYRRPEGETIASGTIWLRRLEVVAK